MRVLVTGHHGYIGSVAAPLIAAAGHDVIGLDTYFYEGCGLGADDGNVPALRADVRDVQLDQLEGFDAVVHLAGLSNDPLGDLDPALTHEINFRATISLATMAKEAGVERFVFASSCSMYGASSPDEDVNEKAPLLPLTAYAESKARSEEQLADLAGASFSPVFMRSATAYGVSSRLRLDLVLNNLVGWAFTTGRVRILSDGTPWRPLVHIEDISRAALALLEAPADVVRAEAFNVGAPSENYQVRDLAEIVREAVPDSEVEYAGSGDPDPRSYRVDFSKFAGAFPDARLDWTARAGAEELLGAYRKANLTFDEFESARYVRLKQLTQLLRTGTLDHELRRRVQQPAGEPVE